MRNVSSAKCRLEGADGVARALIHGCYTPVRLIHNTVTSAVPEYGQPPSRLGYPPEKLVASASQAVAKGKLVQDQEISQIRVLVVDDHSQMRAALRDIIAHEPDMEVVGEAGSGEQAIQLAAALRPDVVIMDVRMPRMDGFEATQRITSAGLPCRVLIVTADGAEELRAKATEVAAAGLLAKNLSSAELLAAVRAVRSGALLVNTARP